MNLVKVSICLQTIFPFMKEVGTEQWKYIKTKMLDIPLMEESTYMI